MKTLVPYMPAKANVSDEERVESRIFQENGRTQLRFCGKHMDCNCWTVVFSGTDATEF